MKIELKNIKVVESLSDETNCFTATVYVDGKKIGELSNRGHGGPDDFHGDYDAFNKAEAWLKDNMDPVELWEGHTTPMDMELYCGQLIEDWRLAKSLKADMRGKVLFIEPGKEGIMALRWKGVRKIEDRHIESVRKSHPNATILNTLPIEKALETYRAAA